MADTPLTVSLLTPEATLYSGPADRVTVPAHNGELGILSHHAKMVARLGAGIARISSGGETQKFFVSGGFVQVADDSITILTDDAGEPGKVDREEAMKMLDEALAAPAPTSADQDIKQGRLDRARARIRIAGST